MAFTCSSLEAVKLQVDNRSPEVLEPKLVNLPSLRRLNLGYLQTKLIAGTFLGMLPLCTISRSFVITWMDGPTGEEILKILTAEVRRVDHRRRRRRRKCMDQVLLTLNAIIDNLILSFLFLFLLMEKAHNSLVILFPPGLNPKLRKLFSLIITHSLGLLDGFHQGVILNSCCLSIQFCQMLIQVV